MKKVCKKVLGQREKGSSRRCPSEETDFKCFFVSDYAEHSAKIVQQLTDADLRGSISCVKGFVSASKQQLFFKVDSVDSILKRHY